MTLPISPPTLAPSMSWPACDVPVKNSCGCGCNGAGRCGSDRNFAGAVKRCPWWIWALALGVVWLAGDERAKSGQARRGRRRR
jgi:hypothetical protein